MILSTVRSLPSYKIESNPTHGWCRQNLGFITDRNQVNVALTRARRGLFIVGTYLSLSLTHTHARAHTHTHTHARTHAHTHANTYMT